MAAVSHPTLAVLAVNPVCTVVEPCSLRVRWGEEAQGDQRAGQVQQPLKQVGSPLVAHPKLWQPSSQESVRFTTRRFTTAGA